MYSVLVSKSLTWWNPKSANSSTAAVWAPKRPRTKFAVLVCGLNLQPPSSSTRSCVTNHSSPLAGCMCPVLYVQNLSTGDKMAVCRNFYSAIKLASVVVPEHTYTDSLCVNCLVKRNANGVIAGADHVTISVVNVQILIDAGRLHIDDETDKVVAIDAAEE